MVLRKIVNINEELCNGCGRCIPKCAEGALQIVNGKAKIVKDTYCDGLGACLGECPQGAITITEREAEAFDEKAVHEHLKNRTQHPNVRTSQTTTETKTPAKPQWPIKLNLVPLEAPFYQNANLLLIADCAPVALKNLHEKLLQGKRVLIGCPKFDDARAYAQKLTEILKRNSVANITVVHMEVPCCSALKWVANKAVQDSGKQIPVTEHIITIGGEIQ
ncbi:MAG: 4Fe-4S binding protein [Candidatus Bathyarchaeota archaeon]|nr:4Fe-4S binding protein [Candidatus Bathyarchaeota archaeon]